ncbi:unnamed protein product [Euphydryas editha]|uniref:Uncharacterized protein n=1 Tax=Euphydryas editha TaxID=104508 RepID=A0AAU9V3N3_EUPED|nr:unnamed protein product [Euphydryas editha]
MYCFPCRCGRTGRERGGQVFILVTEGKEHQTLIESMRQRDVLNKNILNSKEVQNNLYKLNPRMMPQDFTPECQKIFISVNIEDENEKEPSKQSKKRGQKDLRVMFEKASSVSSKERKKSAWITETEFYEIYPEGYRDCNFFSEPVAYWSMNKESITGDNNTEEFPLNLSKWLELQKKLQKTVHIGHSVDTEILTTVLNCDTKKFEPTTKKLVLSSQDSLSQNVFLSPSKSKQTKKRDKNPLTKSPYPNNIDNKQEYLNTDKDQQIENDFDTNPVNDLNSNFDIEIDFDLDSPIFETVTEDNKVYKEEKVFDIGDTSDIFRLSAESSPEKVLEPEVDKSKSIDALDYFHLSSIDDIFEDTDNESPESKSENKVQSLNAANIVDSIIIESDTEISDDETNKQNVSTRQPSPSILSGRANRHNSGSTSPILCSQKQKPNIPKTNNQQFKKSTPKTSFTECIDLKNLQTANDKSMLTITQLVEMINKSENDKTPGSTTNRGNESKNQSKSESMINRTPSPVILTQRDKKNKVNTKEIDKKQATQLPTETLNNSDVIQLDKNNQNNTISMPNKRKFEEDNFASPYFSKKQKVTEDPQKSETLQKKVLAALSKEFNNELFRNNNHVNFMVSSIHLSPKLMSQKENYDESSTKSTKSNSEFDLQSNLDKLQKYRRDKCSPKNNIFKDCTNTNYLLQRKKISFSDSDDDDFITNKKSQSKQKLNGNGVHDNSYHKRKKKNKARNFLDLEAEISDDGINDSEDELTDESVGSIIDFICDENVADDRNMQALYLKSVKSPVKGGFKIPQLVDKYRKSDVFSQHVTENDTYEMDSFCVDSHIGLTQINEVSELELAEMLLEEKRKNGLSSKNKPKANLNETNNESPIIKRKFKNTKRQINSDSEDSS